MLYMNAFVLKSEADFISEQFMKYMYEIKIKRAKTRIRPWREEAEKKQNNIYIEGSYFVMCCVVIQFRFIWIRYFFSKFGTAHIVFTLDHLYCVPMCMYVWVRLVLLTWHWFHANSMIYFVQLEWNESHSLLYLTHNNMICFLYETVFQQWYWEWNWNSNWLIEKEQQQ